jgi:long-chain acyl-CoA synthetase
MIQQPEFETLAELLDFAGTRYAERPAYGTRVGHLWSWITYAELCQRVAQCRAGLANLGIGRGDRIAIIADNRLEWVVVAHAAYQRGAIFVPMAGAQAESEWRYILADSGARVCFVTHAGVARRVSSLRQDLLDLQHIIDLDAPGQDTNSFAHLLALGAKREVPARKPRPSEVATIIYTSGTTGEPKGVRLTHRSLAVNAAARAETRDYGRAARSMSFLPWAHVFGGHVELNVMMAVGGSVAICSSADEMLAELPNVNPTVLYAVPHIWTRLYHEIQRELAAEPEISRNMFRDGIRLLRRQRGGANLKLTERIFLNLADRLVISKLKARLGDRLRLAISGAAPLSIEVASFMYDLGITIYEGYGLTESSGSSTTNPTAAPRFGSVGKPIPGTTVLVDSSSIDETGIEGEIILYGPGVMEGYHNRPEATKQVQTADGGLRTGDRGYVDQEGYLFITGRIKELYKLSNGRYIAPAPLEEKLKLSPFISHCMVYGAGQPHNVALIVVDVPALKAYFGQDHASPDALVQDPRTRRLCEEEIQKHSRDFRTFELVRDFCLVAEPFTRENGMLTASMKLLRRRVLAEYEDHLKRLYQR